MSTIRVRASLPFLLICVRWAKSDNFLRFLVTNGPFCQKVMGLIEGRMREIAESDIVVLPISPRFFRRRLKSVLPQAMLLIPTGLRHNVRH